MDTLNQTVNGKALNDALNLMFGVEATAIVGKLYFAIDSAMRYGYDVGSSDGRAMGVEMGVEMGQEKAEERADEAFDNGFTFGYSVAEEEAEDNVAFLKANADKSWQQGYIDGVDDARRLPGIADQIVQDIINEEAGEFFETYDEDAFDDLEEDEYDLGFGDDDDWSHPIIK